MRDRTVAPCTEKEAFESKCSRRHSVFSQKDKPETFASQRRVDASIRESGFTSSGGGANGFHGRMIAPTFAGLVAAKAAIVGKPLRAYTNSSMSTTSWRV